MQQITNFSDLEISDNLKRAISDMEFETPTPIQSEVIPLILDGKDILAQAPTGTGKTCAFAIPIIQNIDIENNDIQALILCPTRELVIQMSQEFKELLKYTESVRLTPVYGGQNIERQLANLRKKPQIICGTPGRIMDHLRRKTIKIHNLKCLVLDEADEMLDMGFRPDLDVILKASPKERQTVLFSATMPKPIIEISKNYQNNPIEIVTSNSVELPDIEQVAINLKENEKVSAMTDILDSYCYKLVITFCNTKKRADELTKILKGLGYNAEALHGDLRQSQRDRIMKKYRAGDIRILVATDVAARGIDVDDVEAIFNFDTPNDEEYYVHRIGRTARANKTGIAYTFYTDSQMDLINKYERYTKIKMKTLNKNEEGASFESKKLANIFKGLNSNLNDTKSFINKSLKAYNNEHDTDWSALDLLAVVLNGDNGMAMSANSSRRERKPKKPQTPSTRYFLTIGEIDKANADSVKKFVTSKTGIDNNAIIDVHLLDKYGFVEIAEGFEDKMESLNGAVFNGRKINCEVAGERSSGESRRKNNEKSNVKSYEKKSPKTYGNKKNLNSGKSSGTRKSNKEFSVKGNYARPNTPAKRKNPKSGK